MASYDLRPLSLGEILDRTFSLYRNNFLLFTGISAVPHLFVLAWSLAQVVFLSAPAVRARAAGAPTPLGPAGTLAFAFLTFVVDAFVVYVFAQGATAHAVSELYRGRTTSIGAALGQVCSRIWSLAGSTFLNGVTILVPTLFLFVPGVSAACRLITALPAALLEKLGPLDAFKRSFRLTRGNAGRAFVIYLLYCFLRLVAYMLMLYPYRLAISLSRSDPARAVTWLGLASAGNVAGATLVAPFLVIAATVFYFDLRVRKEAFDLKIMLDAAKSIPTAAVRATSAAS